MGNTNLGLRRRRPLRVVGAAVTCAALATAAAGCGGNSSSGGGGASASGPTVTVWSWRSQDAPVWNDVQQALNKQGTHVRIDFRAVTPTSYDAVLRTAMNGGKGPDIFYDRAGLGTMTYAAANLIRPLDNVVDYSTLQPSSLTAVKYQGHNYGVPFAVQTMGVFYNKDVFDKYNLHEPQTWDEFIGLLRTLKGKGVTPMYVMGVQQWLLALQIDAVGASGMSGGVKM